MARSWQPPGYTDRVMRAFLSAQPDGNKSRFADEHGLKPYQVGRWLKALPESHESLVKFSRALGVSWQRLVVGEFRTTKEALMKRTGSFMLLCLLLLSGCASEHWTKRGFTMEQWRQDSAQCRLVGLGVPAGQPGARIGGPGQGLMDVSAQFSDLSRREQATDLCLEAKGYYRIPAP